MYRDAPLQGASAPLPYVHPSPLLSLYTRLRFCHLCVTVAALFHLAGRAPCPPVSTTPTAAALCVPYWLPTAAAPCALPPLATSVYCSCLAVDNSSLKYDQITNGMTAFHNLLLSFFSLCTSLPLQLLQAKPASKQDGVCPPSCLCALMQHLTCTSSHAPKGSRLRPEEFTGV